MTERERATLLRSNPNIETRNPKQIKMSEIRRFQTRRARFALTAVACSAFGRFEHLGFVFRICFVFRASDFEFAGQAEIQEKKMIMVPARLDK